MEQYWDLHPTLHSGMENDEFVEKISAILNNSIELHSRSDVPVGTFLSGGLDSSIHTAILKPNNTWTVGFEELNEFNWSDLANRNLDTVHHKTIVDKEMYIKTN